jgi:hypothetical protein
MRNTLTNTARISAKERLDISGSFSRLNFVWIVRFQFQIVCPPKSGARWRHCVHNSANNSKMIRMFKTGQSTKFSRRKVKSIVCLETY